MKKVRNKLRLIISFCFVAYLLLFNAGCGLDVYYIIDPPAGIVHQPVYTGIDPSDRYFEFWTNNSSSNLEGFSFEGTEIYYKIYNNYSTMTSEVSVIQQLANDVEKSGSSFDRVESYKYMALRCNGSYSEPLIPSASSNQLVYVRLTDYQNIGSYSARILVNGNYINGNASNSIPVRNKYNRTTFNFGRHGGADAVPVNGDDDTRYGSPSADGKWYVVMFAVGVGHDSNYTNYHSAVTYLGAVTIDSTVEDN